MVLVVKCLICQKELTYSQSNPVELIQHMKFEHPLARKSKQTVGKDIESSLGVNAEKLKELVDKSVQTEKEIQSGMASGNFKIFKNEIVLVFRQFTQISSKLNCL